MTRASDQAEGDARKFDNTALMGEILALRKEEAQLLGYANFGEVSVVPKMAKSPARVTHFLRDLIAFVARPLRGKTWPICEFARTELVWESPGVGLALCGPKSSKGALRVQRAGDQTVLHSKVLAGLFKIIETLFEVAIRRGQRPGASTPRSSFIALNARTRREPTWARNW